ncbi:LruC domain-containing protein [Alteromonas sp. BMJM2]|uniref:LruC domain-containing protein n=1 Tax=Alteromonas sp. BMJM2 TaxID=2954241 RepID=UPI0022B4EF68|nr:LruC domain-containing protein [Alteromonas sp. BMJM2]
MKTPFKPTAAMLLAFSSLHVSADAFDTCPSQAFLMQDTTAQLYGVNLVTGNVDLLSSNLGTNNRINGFGFSNHDRYLYGWGYESKTIVRIGDDFQIEPLNLTNKPGADFFVGDVALSENAYYLYKKGSKYGLYRVSLDENDDSYLDMQQVIDGASLSMLIYDLAFHPSDGFAYSVDKYGDLYRIDVANGSKTKVSNVGQRGTFGAVYFDVNGTFYISRNQDGNVFRIDVAGANPKAELFAYGPSSGNNDGARCAMAPIIDESIPATTDFGDAPDTYLTSLSSNGARHGVVDGIHLGNGVDAEYDAHVFPNSDELTNADEDGVNFITAFEAGLESFMQVSVEGDGYLSMWVDWDQNGTFEASEQLIADKSLTTGTHFIFEDTPLGVTSGVTWARVRYTSTSGVGASGGVIDGEVEDYQVAVVNPGNSLVNNTPYFLAFEDNWPETGDYDFNDVVIRLDSSMIVSQESTVKKLSLSGELTAMGASYNNGFAIQLEGITNEDIDSDSIRFSINGKTVNTALLEDGTDNAVLKISDDLWKHVTAGGCWFYKTEEGCTSQYEFKFSISLQLNRDISLNSFPQAPYKPFIFATENTPHGDAFANNPGRGLEIHLKNKSPTSLANMSYFGLAEDASDVSTSTTYQTENGLPWAIAINASTHTNWLHPQEYVDILKAYPKFSDFVTTNGEKNQSWFTKENADSTKVYSY